jgi:tRNA-dihydrouridine synthase B
MVPVIRDYYIRNVRIFPNLVLAPMSGVTSCAFRRLVRELNPGTIGLVLTEFISVEGLTRQSRRSLDMMRFHETERPLGIQIFGSDIFRMTEAARMVEASGADIVDINCGCPAPKVVRRGGGCELMRQPEHLTKMLRAVRAAVKIPLTIKFRSGWDSESLNAMEIAKMAESEGVEAVTVHGRTRAQLYRGEADWKIVRDIADSLSIPVCGSGDVVDTLSFRERMGDSKVAGAFVGRAALWNPFVFSDITSGVAGLPSEGSGPCQIRRPTEGEILERYIELLREEFSPKACIGKLKQLSSQMARGKPWSKQLCRTNTFDEQVAIVQSLRREERDSAQECFTSVRSEGDSVASEPRAA